MSPSSIPFALPVGQEVRITTGALFERYPDVSDDLIIWQSPGSIVNTGFDILAYDLETGETRVLLADPGNQRRPRISGDWITWEDYRNGPDGDIYAGSLSSGTVLSLQPLNDDPQQ